MAYVELLAHPPIPLFCNVHQSVGPHRANARTDVLLVQYLLKVFFEGGTAPKPPGAPLLVDGFAGSVTFSYIKAFQTYGKAKGYNILPDGYVDRATGGVFGSATGSQYTIVHLNNAFNSRYPVLARHVWCAPDCPPDLSAALVDASRPRTVTVVETHGGGV